MTTNKIASLAFSALLATAAGCGSSTTTTKLDSGAGGDTGVGGDVGVSPDGVSPGGEVGGGDAGGAAEAGGVTEGGVAGDGGVAACTPLSATCAPQLGAQIDRMGRPGVNTALTDPFWDNGTRTAADHKAQQDKYNQASNPGTWGDVELAPGKKVKDAIKGAVAAYDALDGMGDGTSANDGCGNQLAFGQTCKGMKFADYTLLSTVLVDDRLYLNTDSRTCTTYLAVEANEIGVTNTDCGGRTPTYNTIDITYSALVTGKPLCTTMCDVTNGITSDADKGANYSETTFPFLGDPTP